MLIGEVPYSNCSKAWQTFNAKSVYSDPVAWSCNTPDKIICTRAGYAQVWSMCNAWSSTSGLYSFKLWLILSMVKWLRYKFFFSCFYD